MKPIPEGTVKVYFSIIEAEGGENEIEFNFENESLKHRAGNTMRSNMYEVSIFDQNHNCYLNYILVMD